MAYNTTAIKTDVNGKPIPQYFDPLADEYRPLQGEHGASRAVLYGPDGQPINSNNALPVSDQTAQGTLAAILAKLIAAPATEAKQDAIKTVLDTLAGKDYATQTTLAAVLAKISSDPSTGAKQDAIKNVLDAISGKVATEGKLEEVRALLATIAGTDFATQATLAQVKAELEAVKAELEAVKANQVSGDQKVSITGSYPEYRQLSTDPEPDAATAGKGATIYQIDTGIAKISNGTTWEVL